MSSKDAPQKMKFFGTIKKMAHLFSWRQNAKTAEYLHNIDRLLPKIGLNPNCLAYSNST